MELLITALAAYLLGSISFAILVSRIVGMPDPRSYGSGNPGATNVLRTGRRAAAAATLAGDAGKGAVAVMLALGVFAGDPALAVNAACVAGVAAFLGHLFPLFHGFAGGKGVATAAGVLLAWNPWLGLAVILTWVTFAVFFRYSSLAALAAAVFAPAYCFWLFGLSPLLPASLALSLLLVWRHKDNIRRLIDGTESRIGTRRNAA
jgi:glycerol-3-phosphate acyltransferase PlsY